MPGLDHVAERRRLEEALRESERRLGLAQDELREADRRKDELLGFLSHELRNPLAPVRNSLYVLSHAEPGGEQARRALAVIGRQIDQLTRLIEDLLEVKRLSVGKLGLQTQGMNLARAVRETVDDLRPLFERRGIALSFAARGEPVWVLGDAVRLSQVVVNLLQNALKFTDAGGHVEVSVERGEKEARIRVRDDGVGVAPELLHNLFEPFVQGERTGRRDRGGLGLGLALVRGIVELHGGTVVGRSDGVGKGSEFVVTLPAIEPVPARPPPVRATSEPAITSRRRVLVIEDDEDAALSLRDVLEMDPSCEVHVASDGRAGLEAARLLRPDVVLCDLGLPLLDGYEVARQLRAGGGAARATLVALSGFAGPADIARALQAGFDRHLAKPADLDELARIIANAPRSGSPTMDLPPELVTGHRELDSQHAAILAELERMRGTGPDAVKASLTSFQQHTASHFASEELLMDDESYPERAAHKQAHLALIEHLLELRSRLERRDVTDEVVAALLDEVEGWVVDHELRRDLRLVEFIRSEHASA